MAAPFKESGKPTISANDTTALLKAPFVRIKTASHGASVAKFYNQGTKTMNQELYKKIHKEQIERLKAECEKRVAEGIIVSERYNPEWIEDCDAYIADQCFQLMETTGTVQVLDEAVHKMATDYFNDELHGVWEKHEQKEPVKDGNAEDENEKKELQHEIMRNKEEISRLNDKAAERGSKIIELETKLEEAQKALKKAEKTIEKAKEKEQAIKAAKEAKAAEKEARKAEEERLKAEEQQAMGQYNLFAMEGA